MMKSKAENGFLVNDGDKKKNGERLNVFENYRMGNARKSFIFMSVGTRHSHLKEWEGAGEIDSTDKTIKHMTKIIVPNIKHI